MEVFLLFLLLRRHIFIYLFSQNFSHFWLLAMKKKRSHAICLCALFLQANIYAKAFEEAHSLLSPGVLTHTNNVNACWWIFILVAEQKICSIFFNVDSNVEMFYCWWCCCRTKKEKNNWNFLSQQKSPKFAIIFFSVVVEWKFSLLYLNFSSVSLSLRNSRQYANDGKYLWKLFHINYTRRKT